MIWIQKCFGILSFSTPFFLIQRTNYLRLFQIWKMVYQMTNSLMTYNMTHSLVTYHMTNSLVAYHMTNSIEGLTKMEEFIWYCLFDHQAILISVSNLPYFSSSLPFIPNLYWKWITSNIYFGTIVDWTFFQVCFVTKIATV